MGLESATYIDDLITSNPDGGVDSKSEGDNHIRMIKSVLRTTFPGQVGRFSRWQAKSGSYTIVAIDNWSLIEASGALTLNGTAAGTLGNGWACLLWTRNGAITVDPNASELVNGVATFVVPLNHFGLLSCDGSKFVCAIYPSVTINQTLTDAATIAWDMSLGQIANVTLTASGHVIGLPTNMADGTEYTLFVLQDGTGSRTLASWNGVFKWPLGIVPVLSTGANAVDMFVFKRSGNMYGSMLKGMA